MIIKTAGSIYEVDEGRSAFRLIHQLDSDEAKMPIGTWCRYQRMSPVVVGEPVRFFWANGEEAGLTRIGLWSSSPVMEILSNEEADSPPGRGPSARHVPPFLVEERRAQDNRSG